MKKNEIQDIANMYANQVTSSINYQTKLKEIVKEIKSKFSDDHVNIIKSLSKAIHNVTTKGDSSKFLEIEQEITELIKEILDIDSETQTNGANDN